MSIKDFFKDMKTEKQIDKKIKKIRENESLSAEKKRYEKMGLSEAEAEFKAKKAYSREKRRKTINSVASGLGGAVEVLSGEIGTASQKPPAKKAPARKKSSSKKKSSGTGKRRGGGGGGNPLEMDIPGFRI